MGAGTDMNLSVSVHKAVTVKLSSKPSGNHRSRVNRKVIQVYVNVSCNYAGIKSYDVYEPFDLRI